MRRNDLLPALETAARINNFDLLRFFFAFVVFLVHAHVLTGAAELRVFSQWLSSELAVQGFFIVSGFLIFMSYENSTRLGSYFDKRVRRIYPAYVAVVLLAAAAGTLISSLSPSEYVFSAQLWRYLGANLLFLNFLQPDLPGVFADNRMQAVNGALWTLKIEVMFYLAVPLLAWMMRKWGRWQIIVSIYVLSLLYVAGLAWWGEHGGSPIYRELQRQLPGQLVWFMAGATLYYYFEQFQKIWPWLLAAAAPILLFRHETWIYWLVPVAMGIVVVYGACIFRWLGNFGKFGDFSYGVYILHFPILQTLIAIGMMESAPVEGLLLAIVLVLVGAYLFWHLIEKPFLQKSSHYIEVNRD